MNPNMVTGPRASLREALEAITKNGRQAVLVADAEGVLAGMVTDGDLRRAILRGVPLDEDLEGSIALRSLADHISACRDSPSHGLHGLPQATQPGNQADQC